MLPHYPLADLLAYLAQHGKELGRDAAEFPADLANERGRMYLLNADWAPDGHLVVHFPPTFPDTLPKIYLAKGAPRPAIVPHVNRPGQICCFEASTVVNATIPLSVLTAVVDKAKAVWTKQYSPEERLREVEAELTAYWENSEYNPLFLCDDSVETERVVGVIDEVLPSRREIHRVATLTGTPYTKQCIGLVVNVPREQILSLLADAEATIRSLPDLEGALKTLRAHLAMGTIHKRAIECWLLLRCETSTGRIWLSAQVVKRLSVDLRRANPDAEIRKWVLESPLRRVKVQDLRGRRLRARTAGAERSDDYAGLRVALVGCGSLGGFLADGLARAGVNHWLLMDTDQLRPENLARHLLGFDSLYLPKAEALASALRRRTADIDVNVSIAAVQTETGLKAVERFGPTVLVSATGDTNTDLTLSELCRRGALGDCCFVWVEPNLSAGHLVYQPQGSATGLHDLHEQVGADAYYYRHRVVAEPRTLHQTESGCQVAFTPYSGADMQHFAHATVIELARMLSARPTALTVQRFQGSTWHTITT